MRIGIDISQIVHEGTGVASYVRSMVATLVSRYPDHEFVLFGASLRKKNVFTGFVDGLGKKDNVRLVMVPIPPTVLDVLWNIWHVAPVEWITGPIDIFWSSDWTQPPLSSAVGVTTIHDLSILKYPNESSDKTGVSFTQARIQADIVAVQKRRLARAKAVCDVFFCDSQATRDDVHALLGISKDKLRVVYPGYVHTL